MASATAIVISPLEPFAPNCRSRTRRGGASARGTERRLRVSEVFTATAVIPATSMTITRLLVHVAGRTAEIAENAKGSDPRGSDPFFDARLETGRAVRTATAGRWRHPPK